MKNNRPPLKLSTILIGIAILTLLIMLTTPAKSQPKPLHNGWYNYKQLVKRGYRPEKFKGRKFITYQVYQKLYSESLQTNSNPIK